eukprot:12617341-Alexandrium_andersonii.AAC.1
MRRPGARRVCGCARRRAMPRPRPCRAGEAHAAALLDADFAGGRVHLWPAWRPIAGRRRRAVPAAAWLPRSRA